MMMSRTDRVEVYQYTPDYEYFFNKLKKKHFMSINQGVREGGAHLAGLQRVLINGGTSRDFRYSTVGPVTDPSTGKLILPFESRVLDPFKGTGSAVMSPLRAFPIPIDGNQVSFFLRKKLFFDLSSPFFVKT